MVSAWRALSVLMILLGLSQPAAATADPPALLVVVVNGTPQPVPPIIDIGVVKPRRVQTITQTLTNTTGVELPISSITVVAGAFDLGPPSWAEMIPPGGSFAVTVMATGEGTGPITGLLQIVWGGVYGSATIDLKANVDLVDAEAPNLALAKTGFETGTLAPFAAAIGLPAPQVTAAAALSGTYGLAVAHSGSTTPSFIQYFFPNLRPLVRGQVTFDPNSLEIPNSAAEIIVSVNDYGLPIAWLEVHRNRLNFELRVVARLDNGTTGASGWLTIPDAPAQLVFDWWAGSPGNYEGGVRVRHSTGFAIEYRSTGLNFPRVRNLRYGAVSAVSPATVGSFYFDEAAVLF